MVSLKANAYHHVLLGFMNGLDSLAPPIRMKTKISAGKRLDLKCNATKQEEIVSSL